MTRTSSSPFVSLAFTQILNLRHAADAHVPVCPGESCNVSLFMLLQTAKTLAKQAPPSEARVIAEILADWPL